MDITKGHNFRGRGRLSQVVIINFHYSVSLSSLDVNGGQISIVLHPPQRYTIAAFNYAILL